MSRCLATLCLLAVLAAPGSGTPKQTWRDLTPTRKACCLNGEWDFLPTTLDGLATPQAEDGWPPAKLVVPSSWRDTVAFDYPAAWQQVSHAWCRRSFEVPKASGARVRLRFDAVSFDARVFVNGRAVGRHRNAFTPFVCDITDAVSPDTANLLQLGVSDCSVAQANGRWIAPVSEMAYAGPWQDVWVEVVPEVHVEEPFAITSVAQHTLTVRCLVVNDGKRVAKVTLSGSVSDWALQEAGPPASPVLSLPGRPVTIPAGASRPVEVSAPWPSPRLWTPADPYLYSLWLELRDGSGLRDVSRTRLGFREFGIDGAHFTLNGKRINLRGDSFNRMASFSQFRPEYVRLYYQAMRAMNVNVVRPHTAPYPPIFYDLADEMGMMIVDEGMMNREGYDFADRERFLQHYEQWVKRDRNHPSVILWSIENECNMGEDPQKAKWLSEYGRLVEKLDGTRPVLYEGDADECGATKVLDYHYPHELPAYSLYPETNYWLADTPGQCSYKTKWDGKRPVTLGEFTRMFSGRPEDWTFYAGDSVYADLLATDSGLYRAIAETDRLQVEALRASGAASIKPWTPGCHGFRWLRMDRALPAWSDLTEPGVHPKRAVGEYSYTMNPGLDPRQPPNDPRPVVPELRRAFEPVRTLLREMHRNYPSGGTLTRRLYVFNDLLDSADIEVAWSVRVNRDKVAGDEVTVPLPAGEQKELAIRATLPQVRTPPLGAVEVTTAVPGRKPFVEQQEIQVFPSPPADIREPLGVFGPEAFLAQVRAVAPNAKPVPGPTPQGLEGLRVLAVAPGALGDDVDASGLEAFVRDGGRVVAFAQDDPPRWAPVSLSLVRTSGTIAFARQAAHFVLRGLRDENLRYWLDDNVVFRSALAKPVRGNARAIIDAGDANGLSLAPLVEARWGRGLALFCQLAIAQQASPEPVAALLFHNLLEYAANAPARENRPVALVASARSPLRRFLRRVGARTEDVDPDDIRLSRYKAIIVDARERALVPEDLPEWVFGGGTLLVHCATFETPSWLPEAWRQIAVVRPPSLKHQQLEVRNRQRAALAGWCNEDLWWPYTQDPIVKCVVGVPEWGTGLVREPSRTGPITATRYFPEAIDYDQNRSVPIDQPGWALVEVAAGKGRAIVDQVEWDTASPSNLRALRLGAAMLDAIGVEMDLSPQGKTQAIDLRHWCNVGLTDAMANDKRGGSTDRGEWDLRTLPVGEQRLRGCPFTVIDEKSNDGRAAIVLCGTEKPHLPRSAVDIRVGLRVRALYFLQACAWSLDQPAPIAKYVVRYADGRLVQVPVVYGVHVADWYQGPRQLPDAEVAWTGKSGPRRDATLYWMRWDNPRPEKDIATIDFVTADSRCVPALLAITAELAD